MRYTLVIFASIVLITLSSCHGFGKKGNGHVTTEDRTVSPFSKITIEGVFPVELSQNGGAESVKVETDENLQDMITVKTEGDELIIKTDEDKSFSRSTLGSKFGIVLTSNFMNEATYKACLKDDYEAFLNERSHLLTEDIKKLVDSEVL